MRGAWNAVAGAAVLAAATAASTDAKACGGFFCSRTPVDQNAEHILFVVGPGDATTMVVQIGYAGGDSDFSWVLPLGSVPAADSLQVFPQLALSSLAANTGPLFNPAQDCWTFLDATAGGECSSGLCGSPPSNQDDVTVHLRAEVGPYDVAVVESADPSALVAWLRTNGYRITSAMEPYIGAYTSEGMKFLALKLLPAADVSQIQPLMMTLPGTTPMVPIRLTAIAAEPEMGILVSIIGDQRFEPANWPNVTIADNEIAYDPYNTWGGNGTNWLSLVAQKVDQAGGQGWVTEYAGTTAEFLERIRSSTPSTQEATDARDALLGVMDGRAYLSRLYTRLSPEEMATDPMFRRSLAPDVSRMHQLSRYVGGVDMCPDNGGSTQPPACDFTTCGAGGLCAEDPNGQAGCACVDSATARAVAGANGSNTVVCQDERMSFVNPGDIDVATGMPLADPCLAASCGGHGRCVSMNMTPTCKCDRGFVAVAQADGSLNCAAPRSPIPNNFYARDLPAPAHPGRDVSGPPSPANTASGCACAIPVGNTPWALLGLMLLGALRLRRVRGAAGVVTLMMAVSLPTAQGCGAAPEPQATVEIGTGESQFETLADQQQVTMVHGVQGGYHVWMALKAQGLDPAKVWVDVDTTVEGQKFSSRAITAMERGQDGSATLVGHPVILDDPQGADGKDMNLHVRVTDQQGVAAESSVNIFPRMP